jgi:hypothetical protein
MHTKWYLLIVAAACGCGQAFHNSRPLPPANVRRLALRPIVNKTQTPGLEDALMARTRDEFLRDGRCPLVPEGQAEDVVRITITRYLNTPVQYDATLAPTAYKISIRADVEFLDAKKTGPALWTEKDLDEIEAYAAPTLAGGLTEAQAQADIWDIMSRDIVQRVMDGLAGAAPAASAASPQQAPAVGKSVRPAPAELPIPQAPAGAPTR